MVTATESMRFLPFLAPAEEGNLLTEGPVKEFDRNDLVLEQDVIVRAIFLIEEGSVRVERQEKGQKVRLAGLGAGEFFGQMFFLYAGPTKVTVAPRGRH